MAITKVTLKKDPEKVKAKRKREKRQILIMIMVVILGICIFAGTSYAIFSTFVTGTKEHTIIAGIFTVDFNEGSKVVLDNTYPLNDEKGLKTAPYTFTIENTGNIDAMYRIKLEEDTTNPSKMLSRNQVKISFKKDDGTYSTPQLLSTFDSQLILVTDQTLNVGETASYEIKMWVDEEAGNMAQGKEYRTKIVVESVQKMEGEYPDTIPPVITLSGNVNQELKKGATYTESGVSSVVDDIDGTIATSKVTKSYEYYNGSTTSTVSSVNTNNVGVYYITYKVSDSNGNQGIAVRTVTVNNPNTSSPTLTLYGSTSISMFEYQTFEEPGYSVTGGLVDRVVIIGSPAKKPGSYVIKYIIMNDDGNFASKTRTITVVGSTSSNCFTVNDYGTLTEYKCNSGNSYGNPTIKDVIIPGQINGINITTIGYRAFYNKGLTSVVIPDTVTNIEYESFMVNQLASVTLSNKLNTISQYAFSSNQITSLTIPNSVTTIYDHAFYGNQLTSIVIPVSVKHLSDNAFGSNKLTSVTIKGKSSTADFEYYSSPVFGWAAGYGDANIKWNG